MKQKNWKHAVALGLALAIVLSAGILNSGNWLHANEDETVAQEAPATEAPATEGVPEETQATQPAVQGNTVTEQIVLEETKPAETTAPTVAQEETKPVETTAPTVAQEETKPVETTAPTAAQEETKPVETTAPTVAQEETKPVETTAPTVAQEETKPAETTAATEETTAPTEETTAPTEETTVPTEETQPILEAAELPLTVTLVDTEGNPVGDGTWITTVNFAKGSTTATIAAPKVAGYITPEAISVERTAETTELTATAVYEAEPATFTITVKIENAEQGEVKVNNEKIGDGFTQEMQEGETFTFTAAAADGCRMKVEGAKLKDESIPGEYTVETNVDKTVTITFKAKTPEELVAEALDPNRSVSIAVHKDADILYEGDQVTLEAVLSGYDNVNYTLQWRYSLDDQTWQDCPGQTGESMTITMDSTNYKYYWNVLVTITGLKEPAAEQPAAE